MHFLLTQSHILIKPCSDVNSKLLHYTSLLIRLNMVESQNKVLNPKNSLEWALTNVYSK